MAFNPITTDGFKVTPLNTDMGPASTLQWVDIDDLVVDDTYQRPIARAGTQNIIRIAATFRWEFFAAVVVSPVEGGKFSIVDGQHRVTAAKIRGIKSVPCQLVIADQKQQAAAFRAINGVQTAMTPLALFHAETVAGVKEALEIQDACTRAGVTILKASRLAIDLKPGQTTAIAAIQKCYRQYGKDMLILTLRCITETRRNKPGAINALNIASIAWALATKAEYREKGVALLRGFDYLELDEIGEEAKKAVAQTKGATKVRVMAQLIGEHLNKHLFGYQLEKAHA